jgi:hypothetical protein
MSLEQYQPPQIDLPVNFEPGGEYVDCAWMGDHDLIMLTPNINDVQGKCYDSSEPDDRMKAVVDAVQALANKGDVVFDDDFCRNFGNEVEDLRRAQQALYDGARMHTLVGRSADRSTLFLVFAPTAQARCVAFGKVKRRR